MMIKNKDFFENSRDTNDKKFFQSLSETKLFKENLVNLPCFTKLREPLSIKHVIKISSFLKNTLEIANHLDLQEKIKKEIIKTYPNIDINQIENWIDEFFDSDLQIEEYAIAIPDYKSRLLALRIGTCAAASDGLNLKESLSLLKVCSLYGINIKEVLND